MQTPEATLYADTLARCRRRGEELVGLTSLVGDQDDLHTWRQKRNAWVTQTAAVLAVVAGDAAAGAFRACATVNRPLTGWHMAITGELRILRQALELLGTFATQEDAAHDD
jgi:hypothetical protein